MREFLSVRANTCWVLQYHPYQSVELALISFTGTLFLHCIVQFRRFRQVYVH